jgi:hypothetical protein
MSHADAAIPRGDVCLGFLEDSAPLELAWHSLVRRRT